MTTYKELFGKPVKHLSADPTDAEAAGQVWYNTTSGTFKSIVSSGAWSSASSMITARNGSSGGGIQTAAIVFGGLVGPGAPNRTALTEEYNGSGFSAGGALNTARYDPGGTGLQTAALAVGGTDGTSDLAIVEEYDGSAWSEQTNIPAGRKWMALFGTQTAAVMTAGNPNLTTSFKYDGTNWTTTGALSTGRSAAAKGSGVQTAGLCVGGQVPAVTNATEEFDGSSWTAGGNLNTARKYSYGGGIQTSSLIGGGSTPPGPGSAATELYDGTSWTTNPATMGTASYSGGSASNSPDNTAGLAMGGWKGANSGGTEEFNVSINTITPGAWAAGGNLPAAKGNTNVSVGTATTCLSVGGMLGPGTSVTNVTDEYDGATWSGGGTYPISFSAATGSGPAAASWVTGGITSHPAGPTVSTTNTYDGSSWTGGTAYPGTIINAGGCGTQTAGLAWGGLATWTTWPGTTNTFEYDGPSWTAGGALPAGGVTQSGCTGTQIAALSSGGSPAGNANTSYNGTSWTAETVMPRSWPQSAASGTQTATISYLCANPTASVESIHWDGTSWATQPSLGTGRYAVVGRSGTAASAIAAGGYFGPPGAGRTISTEEFTAATTAANIKTITTS